MLKDRADAYELLKSKGASERLLQHARLVAETADLLLAMFRSLGVPVDFRIVQLGAVLHDAGKTQHTKELSAPGSLHEEAGEALLLACGVGVDVARCCTTHGAWRAVSVTLEERTVALADKLWKGRREPELELAVIDEVANRLGVSRWDVFERLDSCFEEIAGAGDARLQASLSKSA